MEMVIKNTEQSFGNNRINPHKFALWIIMGSILMMFGAFISAYIVKSAAANWQEFSLPSSFYTSTLVILLSSLTLHSSYSAFKNGKEIVYKSLLVLTLILGFAFIVFQYKGWNEMFAFGIDLKGSVSGAFVYLISAVHALHVLGGIAAIIVAIIHAFLLKYKVTDKRLTRFELTLHYWHFVDLLWVILFGFLLLYR